ncbi:hypothetical protein ACVBEH_15320 [Roseateles sp. GG27B]
MLIPVSGSVAVGMALSNAKLRILDGAGKAVASAVAVPANGNYGPITLTGTGPFRLEACGYAAERYRCVYAVTPLGGTTNLTPLTTAVAVLAAGQTAEALLLAGSALTLDTSTMSTNIATAQTQLRSALSAAIIDAGLPNAVDFTSAAVIAGSRIGHDRLLDNLGLGFGVDGSKPFVQITPRLGSGSLYLEPGTTQGQISINPAAASLNLAGLETLMTAMTAALANTTACSASMPSLLASNARITIEDGLTMTGTQASQGLCFLFAGVLGNLPAPFGSTMQSPELGRCDFSGSLPVCKISLVTMSPTNLLQVVGKNQAVTLQSDGWRLLGNMQAIQVSAQARVQKMQRVDGGLVDSYARTLSVSIPLQTGLQCARVSQTNLSGQEQTLAYYKPQSGATLLSVWAVSASDGQASINPTQGVTRGMTEQWWPIVAGADGDAVVRNFYRSGRELKVSLYGDAACTTAFTPTDGSSSFSLELAGVPPLEAALPSLPWPVLSASSITALVALKGTAKAKLTYTPSWTFGNQVLGLEAASLCLDSDCTAANRLVELLGLTASLRSSALAVTVGSTALASTSFKQLRLQGRSPEGLLMHSDFQSCSAVTAGQTCK